MFRFDYLGGAFEKIKRSPFSWCQTKKVVYVILWKILSAKVGVFSYNEKALTNY